MEENKQLKLFIYMIPPYWDPPESLGNSFYFPPYTASEALLYPEVIHSCDSVNL